MTLDELRAERERIDELIELEEIRTAPWPWPRGTGCITPDIWAPAILKSYRRSVLECLTHRNGV